MMNDGEIFFFLPAAKEKCSYGHWAVGHQLEILGHAPRAMIRGPQATRRRPWSVGPWGIGHGPWAMWAVHGPRATGHRPQAMLANQAARRRVVAKGDFCLLPLGR